MDRMNRKETKAPRVISTRERLQQKLVARGAAPKVQAQPQVIGLTDHVPAATPVAATAPGPPGPPGLDRQSITEAISEAKDRSLDFDPSERAMTVKQNILKMVELMREGKTEKQLREELAPFVEQYPELFKKVLSNDDLTPLQNMMNLMDRMAAGAMSQHEASVIVGRGLADAYIPKNM
jgi:hypothetical protein